MNTQLIRISSFGTEIGFCSRIALFLTFCITWMVPAVSGQTSTTVNLSTQSRNPDFSSMPVTRPVSVGTSLPSTCTVGQLFFNSSAPAGTNLYSCTSANTWSGVGIGSLALPLSVANGGNGTSTPGLVAGANVTITGNWPSQTINATGTGGTSGNATAIQGASVSATAPANNQTLVYTGASSSYVPTSLYTLQNGLGTTTAGATNLQVNVSMGVRAVTSVSDVILAGDCGGLVTYNNAAAVAVQLPQPALANNFVAGCPLTVRNYGAGVVTVTPSNSTIGGAASQAVNSNKGCLIVSDGTNWQLGNCN
jgi:hypothetical protein